MFWGREPATLSPVHPLADGTMAVYRATERRRVRLRTCRGCLADSIFLGHGTPKEHESFVANRILRQNFLRCPCLRCGGKRCFTPRELGWPTP
jgi:hypothetical protein